MSRTAVGWIPTKVGTTKLLMVDDLDDTDGLSADDMAAVLRHECSLQSPLDAQQEACLLYTSPSPRDRTRSRMPSSA